MFTRGFKRFCTNATRRSTCSTTSSTTIRNGGNAYKSHRNGGSKNTGFGGPTGYATYRTRTEEIIMKDFGNTMKRTSRSTQALENRMLMRAVRPTASILVQAAADSALAILMDEEEDDGTYVNEIYYIEIYIHTYTHTHIYSLIHI